MARQDGKNIFWLGLTICTVATTSLVIFMGLKLLFFKLDQWNKPEKPIVIQMTGEQNINQKITEEKDGK